MTREEAITVIEDAIITRAGVSSREVSGLELAGIVHDDAVAAFDALAPYVVMRDQMEQVGWQLRNGEWRSMGEIAMSHRSFNGMQPVFVIREASDD